MEKTYSQDELQIVVFRLGAEEYGLSILQVQEIKRVLEITRVPNSLDFIKGVINLRGSVVPVIDLAKRLELPPQEHTADTRIIIVKHEDISVGMIVDAVMEVTNIRSADIEPVSAVSNGSNIRDGYINGMCKSDNRLIILLELNGIIPKL